MNKTLVVYYSHSGNTKKLAGKIAELNGADLLELVPEQAYPQDYNTVVEQAKREIRAGFYPKLKNKLTELAQYNVILAGTPNWWSTMAPPVGTFLKDCNLTGKKVAVFATHGGGGFGHIERDFKALCQGADVLTGYSVYGASFRESDVKNWLTKNKIL